MNMDSDAHPNDNPSPISSPSNANDPRVLNRARFELELEFVQALANPFYLHMLAQQNILAQPEFVNFLKYLLYWKEKDYAQFIQYPHALHHLDLLQYEAFRADLKNEHLRQLLDTAQFEHWKTWRDPEYYTRLQQEQQQKPPDETATAVKPE
ncbi:hypothetical protein HGRIS_002372 [Hohenbuehelia grisea]|uniref:Mediator of RNA polymerase II transcription subunit 31 n=1 Tax=Hohenbuehelia grisea TaxID=104357 RepID=A0ABR3JMD2_9AGAR